MAHLTKTSFHRRQNDQLPLIRNVRDMYEGLPVQMITSVPQEKHRSGTSLEKSNCRSTDKLTTAKSNRTTGRSSPSKNIVHFNGLMPYTDHLNNLA